MKYAGKNRENAVDATEIQFALDLWHSYITNRRKIDQIFAKHCPNGGRKLDLKQFTLYLAELNDGRSPKVRSFKLFVLCEKA